MLCPYSLKIDLEPGVYAFNRESGIGKTFVFQLLKQVSQAYQEKRVLAASYMEYTENELINRLMSNMYDIIMFDRYEMWATPELDSCLQRQRDAAIILLDVKDLNSIILDISMLAGILISEGEVTVSNYAE